MVKSSSFYDDVERVFGRPFQTARLLIKPWEGGESNLMAAFFNADGQAFRKELGWDSGEEFTADYVTETLFDFMRTTGRKMGEFIDPIYTKDMQKIIGILSFYQDQDGYNHKGYFILPSERRQGFGSEAHAAAMNRIERERLFSRMRADINPSNAASRKILCGSGFKKIEADLVYIECRKRFSALFDWFPGV